MSVTTHLVAKYTVQVLTKKSGSENEESIIVRLYNHDDYNCGTIVFKDCGGERPGKPSGVYKSQSAMINLDVTFYSAIIDILRYEREIYWKIAWVQMGKRRQVSHASLDTKKDIIGEFFPQPQ